MRAGIDLLVVDEAQRLRRPPGHPGDAAWRAVAPIAALGRHVLLLSATPLEDDAHGFFRLLQLLRPQDFPEEMSIEARLAEGTPLPACTSATRRADIGGLPPRVGIPIELTGTAKAKPPIDVETACEARPRPTPSPSATRSIACGGRWRLVPRSPRCLVPTKRHCARRRSPWTPPIRGSSGWCRRRRAGAPRRRRRWSSWRIARRSRCCARPSASGHNWRPACFTKALTPARRDTEVALFREVDGPSLLVSTECGGEGRNFEFCRRLVLFDLPWKPSVVEQRIGRLDRIGRRIPVEVVYFRPASGIGRDVVRLFEALGLFREPLAGLEPQLAPVEGALEADRARSGRVALRRALRRARRRGPRGPHADSRSRVSAAASRSVSTGDGARHSRARPEGAGRAQPGSGDHGVDRPGIHHRASARSPRVLHRARQRRARSTAYRACRPVPATSARSIVRKRSRTSSSTSSRPGIRWSKASLRTTKRAPSAARCGSRSRWAQKSSAGLIAIYKDGRAFEVVAIDVAGNARPDWAAAVLTRPINVRPVTGEAAKDHRVAEHGAPARRAARSHPPSTRGRRDRGPTGFVVAASPKPARQGRASSTMLNGVSAARRKRVNPP